MKKILFIPAFIALLASCKEVPVMYDQSERGADTTYMAPVEAKQTKLFLVEEPSGVSCVNCPSGTELLKTLNSTGEFKDRLAVVSIHSGSWTDPITKPGYESIQDFRTEEGLQILNGIFGGDPGKPCAGFDRLPLAITGVLSGTILDFKGNWEKMLAKAKEINNEADANIHIDTRTIDANTYEITVKVAYTNTISTKQALTVYITENKIIDFQEFPSKFDSYEFNHLFRKVVTPWNGLAILQDYPTIEAGRVFEQKLIFKIDPTDAKQSFWKPENMEVVAFVHNIEATDKRVLQTAVKHLK